MSITSKGREEGAKEGGGQGGEEEEEEEREAEGKEGEAGKKAEGEAEGAREQKEEELEASGKMEATGRGNGQRVRGYTIGRFSRTSPEKQGRKKYAQLSAAPDCSWGRWG